MNITLNKKTPVIYDFLRVIMFRYNDYKYIEKQEEGGYQVSGRVKDALEFIWTDIETNVPGVALFFQYSQENRCYMFNEFDKRLHEFSDINELIETAFKLPAEKLILSLLKYYDTENRDTEFYSGLITNEPALYEHIYLLDLPDICKWEFYGILKNPELILEPLIQFCHRVKRKLRNVYKQNNEIIQSFNKEIYVRIKNQADIWLVGDIGKFLDVNIVSKDKEIELSYSLINETLIQLYETKNKTYLILGINYEDMLKLGIKDNSSESYDAFLKVFSDKHRMNIFRTLMNKEKYVKQIANEQGMNLSTTSYHLDLLLGVKAIMAKPQGKRIYYTVNKEFVAKQFLEVSKLISSGIY